MTAEPLTQLLSDLVSIRSVNPRLPGACPDDNEKAAGDYVAKYLTRHGVDVELQQVAPQRHNIIGHVPRGYFGYLKQESDKDGVEV